MPMPSPRLLLPAIARAGLLVGCFAAALLASAPLRAASPTFGRLTPTGGQRGTEIEVQLAGERIADALGLLFYEPGLSVTAIEATGPAAAKVKIAIAPDCRLGLHAVRLRTASGISNLRLFAVGALPEINETEPNTDFAQPQKIALDNTVNGVVQNEDVDYFLVDAKKGERITAEIEAVRLGYAFFDPYVAILDMGRFELARSDDTPLLKQDAMSSRFAIAHTAATATASIGSTWGDSRGRRPCCRPADAPAKRLRSAGWAMSPGNESKRSLCLRPHRATLA